MALANVGGSNEHPRKLRRYPLRHRTPPTPLAPPPPPGCVLCGYWLLVGAQQAQARQPAHKRHWHWLLYEGEGRCGVRCVVDWRTGFCKWRAPAPTHGGRGLPVPGSRFSEQESSSALELEDLLRGPGSGTAGPFLQFGRHPPSRWSHLLSPR
jgi:hypothetical protein